jgi:site-specific recombinase XerD
LYQAYLKELTLQGKSPKTVDMYSRCIRQVSVFFDTCPDALSAAELKAYFFSLAQKKSWSAVKIARNAIQFLYRHVPNKPWDWIPIVKPPVVQPLQDVLSRQEVAAIISRTRKLGYQTYYWATYSLGLRLSESLNLTVADIDGHLMRVHLRFTKNKKDRFLLLQNRHTPHPCGKEICAFTTSDLVGAAPLLGDTSSSHAVISRW